MTATAHIFTAPSGNTATLIHDDHGDRSVWSVGWENFPPTGDDIAACSRYVALALRALHPEAQVPEPESIVAEAGSDQWLRRVQEFLQEPAGKRTRETKEAYPLRLD